MKRPLDVAPEQRQALRDFLASHVGCCVVRGSETNFSEALLDWWANHGPAEIRTQEGA